MRLTSVRRDVEDRPVVEMPLFYGRDLGIEYSPDLSPGSWIELGNFFPVGGTARFVDQDQIRAGRPRGFYRGFLRPLVSE